MKKLATLLLAAGLVFSAATGASAIDFKAKGQWIMSFDYGSGSQFMSTNRAGADVVGYGGRGAISQSADNFSAAQRVRLQLDAVASESLSGTVYFEIGDQIWGKAAQGGALGADGMIVELKNAYIDWIVPNTDLKVRMGLQGLALPSFTTGSSQIFDDDVAGIVLSNKFNDNVTLTAFWARPYNDNFTATAAGARGNPSNYMDNVDMFGLLLPLSFDGVKVTPWAVIAGVGGNAVNPSLSATYGTSSMGNAWGRVTNGMMPAVWSQKNGANPRIDQYGTAFWVGITGEVTAADPFRFAWDLNYGGVDYGVEQYKRGGFYGSLLAEYKMDWATPGIYGWYSTGDDDDVKNGSERMTGFDANGNNQFSNYAGNGNPYIAREGVLGSSLIGTWGIGARLKDMSFLEGLKHTFRINFMGGTNSTEMAKYILGKKTVPGGVGQIVTDFNNGAEHGLYLTTADTALEFGLTNTYKIYDNLTFMVDAAYVALFMDDVWKRNAANQTYTKTDAWNINASFVYSF